MIDPSAWKPRVVALFVGAALVWAVSLYGLLVDENLVYALAVVPRRFDGLFGLLGAPLVHGSFAHLAANTFPLLILGGMVAVRGVAYYVTATLAIAVLGGLGLWVFGRSAAHVGASGLIFGYFGLLVGPRPLRTQPAVGGRRATGGGRLRRHARGHPAARSRGLVGRPTCSALLGGRPLCARAAHRKQA